MTALLTNLRCAKGLVIQILCLLSCCQAFNFVSMAFLRAGTAKLWESSNSDLTYIRNAGVKQFINNYNRNKDLSGDKLLWGDEVEYGIFKLDRDEKEIRLSLRAQEVMNVLNRQQEFSFKKHAEGCNWVPEYGSWMIEATPSSPYSGYSHAVDLIRVEENMRLRRKLLTNALEEDEIAPTVSTFPLLGALGNDGSSPSTSIGGPQTMSQYIGDDIINPHERFGAFTNSMRARRGSNMNIRVPLFRDVNTPEFESVYSDLHHDKDDGEYQVWRYGEECSSKKATIDIEKTNGERVSVHKKKLPRPAIHMDSTVFGFGCCCLQVTFQAKDVDESRLLYDQLAVVAPIMMALTASTPIVKGRIADTDCRWGIISEGCDDRTIAERGEPNEVFKAQKELSGYGKRRLHKSRYDSISTFINRGESADDVEALKLYNDISLPIDGPSYKLLRDAGLDSVLSQHVAHLFTRDPLVIYNGAVEEIDDEVKTEHFESIQSTNWQTVRWKPPPQRSGPNDPHIGWRTEFRTMEMQVTDFENAAFTVFVALLSRAILEFNLNLYIPISKVDENMKRAHTRNAVERARFYFRRHIDPVEENSEVDVDERNSFEEMTMKEVMLGKGDYFPGLLPIVRSYLKHEDCDYEAYEKTTNYLDFIEQRASGELMTTASWMRKFVQEHPSYQGDSVVNHEIAFDLMSACEEIGRGQRHEEDLLGSFTIDPLHTSKSGTKMPKKEQEVEISTILDALNNSEEGQAAFNFNQIFRGVFGNFTTFV